jgi:hypothetical protein
MPRSEVTANPIDTAFRLLSDSARSLNAAILAAFVDPSARTSKTVSRFESPGPCLDRARSRPRRTGGTRAGARQSLEAVMKRAACVLMLAVGVLGFQKPTIADGDDHGERRSELRAKLRAGHEVPIVISDASGEFRARVDRDAQTIEYELSYTGLEGSVTQAHIHVGQIFAAGGIMIWLCANNPPIANAPAGTQACPAAPATITGTITPANVVAVNQAVPAGSFDDALAAIRSGNAYVNVHSTVATGGEIRGQLH